MKTRTHNLACGAFSQTMGAYPQTYLLFVDSGVAIYSDWPIATCVFLVKLLHLTIVQHHVHGHKIAWQSY